MGRIQGTLHRLRVAWHLAINDMDYDIRSMDCGYCGSMNIEEIENPIENTTHENYEWSDKVRCKKCGAICEEKQIWKR